MRAFIVACGLFISTAVLAAEVPSPEEAALADGAEAKLRVRVRPLALTPEQRGARLRLDDLPISGPTVGRPPCPVDGLVVVKAGNPVRVRVDDGPLSTLLYLPPQSLQTVVTRKLEVGGRAVPSGLPVTRVGPGGAPGHARVRSALTTSPLEFEVPADAVGTMYLAPAAGEPGPVLMAGACPEPGEGPRVELSSRVALRAGALLHDAPQGLPVARVRQSATLFTEAGADSQGWQEVVYHGAYGQLRLWASPEALEPRSDLLLPFRQAGTLYWLQPEGGREVCQAWSLLPRPDSPRTGGLERELKGPTGKHVVGYAYRDHLGLVELTGPAVHEAPGEDWTDAKGGFQRLELRTCGEGCLEAAPHRWFLKQEDCERARQR